MAVVKSKRSLVVHKKVKVSKIKKNIIKPVKKIKKTIKHKVEQKKPLKKKIAEVKKLVKKEVLTKKPKPPLKKVVTKRIVPEIKLQKDSFEEIPQIFIENIATTIDSTDFSLDEFLVTNETLDLNANFDVLNISVPETYDLETSLLEYGHQAKSESIVEPLEKNDIPVIEKRVEPTIKITSDHIRSSYLVNLGDSKITHHDEVKPVINKTPIFEQPKKTFEFKKRSFGLGDWYKSFENKNKQAYLPGNLKFKMVLQFTAVILLIILPLRVLHVYNALGETKNQVLGVTELGVEGMKSAAEALSQSSWGNAISDFNQASDSFNSALVVLQQINTTSLTLAKNLPIVGSTFNSAQNLLDVGKSSADLASQITKILEQLNNNDTKDLGEKITIIKQGLKDAKVNMERIDTLLKEIDPKSVPESYRPQLELILNNLPIVEKSYKDIDDFINFTEKVMGFDQEKRYVFIFQNNNEIRATGGFMGSFALVDIKKGKITNIEIPGGGFYDLKSSFFEKISSPNPLHLVGYPWGVWDANWWPDFALSSKKIQWFMEKSRWPSVDGVIAFNASLVPNLIKLTGDIDMPQYNKHMTADNVVLALQHAVEFEYDKSENKPKQIIGDMMPILIDRLFKASEKHPLPLILSLHESLKNRDIQMYFNDSELQDFAIKQDWSGQQKQGDDDYLMVVNTNIAGGKTDGVVKQHETVYTSLQDDGSVVHTVAITRTHNGNPSDVFERLNNINYLRVYVPLNSQLIEVTGQNKPGDEYFKQALPGYKDDADLTANEQNKNIDSKSGTDVYQENNKQVFGNWIQVEPGQSSTLTFSYRVLAKNKQTTGWQNWFDKLTNKWHSYNAYSFYWQRQSGSNSSFEHKLTVPKDKNIIWHDSSGQKQDLKDNVLDTSGDLNADVIIAAIFGKS